MSANPSRTITAKKRELIVASLRHQRLDVHIGTQTLADFHRTCDETDELLVESGLEPLPADVSQWGR